MKRFSLAILLFLVMVVLIAGWPVSGKLESGDHETGENYASVAEWTNKAAELNNNGNYEEALNAVNEALKLDSTKYAKPWYNKGNILYNLHRYEESVEAYDMGISIDPSDSDAQYRERAANKAGLKNIAEEECPSCSVADWANKASDLNNAGNYEAALVADNKAISIDPTIAHPWFNKGNILYNLHRYEESVEAYDIGILIDPSDSDAQYRERAVKKAGLKNNAEFDTNTVENDTVSEIWLSKAFKFYEQNKFEETLDACNEALETGPKNLNTWKMKALVLLQLERYEESIVAYDQALKIDPKDDNTRTLRDYAIKSLNK